jgi:hypothetical protein
MFIEGFLLRIFNFILELFGCEMITETNSINTELQDKYGDL